ncbi:MAG TPA: MFS transporter [Hyphomonadaceae bacterium]|nr:MFS transporter [Hyphomonadaceae bacterium]HPN05031.1 MFS transporter [Hyphomonadaceae bacterium]
MPDTPVGDGRDSLDETGMGFPQWRAVAVLAAISALDGYDVLCVTFAAPGIVADWEIDKAAVGLLLSMGLVGMGVGSLLFAPLADRFGRKPLVLASLMIMALGMGLAATSPDVNTLMLWRLLTGLGIGAMVAIITPLSAEYANRKRRPLAVAIMTLGYPAGGVVGGFVAAFLLEHYNWESIFLLGAAFSVMLMPCVVLWAPESIAFLATRRTHNSLARLNAALAKFGRPQLARLPDTQSAVRGREQKSPRLIKRVAQISVINVFYAMITYYMLSWMPQMVADAGFAPSVAASVTVYANLAGIAGGMLMGWAAPHAGLKPLVLAAFIGLSLATVLFGLTPADETLLRFSAAGAGFFLFSGVVGIYALIARSFPAHQRSTGAGLVIGLGRGGSAVAPVVAGFLFAHNFGRFEVSAAMAACGLVSAILLALYHLPEDRAA